MKPPSAAEPSISFRVRSGLMMTGGSDAFRQACEFATSVILARLLMPEDFGIVAVVGSVLQLSFVVGNFGMGTAVIQARNVTDDDRHAAFAMSTLVGAFLTLCVLAAAPWAARFFSMPDLAVVMPVMSVQLVLAGMAAIPLALLRRELAFRAVALIEMGSTVVYAVIGISMALAGFGVWSLVWAPLGSAVWHLVAGFAGSRYRPRLTLRSAALRRLLGFGGGITVKNLFVYLSRNVDNLIVAKALGSHAAGLYTRAFNLTRMPQTRLVTMLYRVCFPAFCKLQDDQPRLHRWYVDATAVVALLAAPILLGLAVVAEDFTVAVLGEHWADMAPVMRILCFSALLNCLHMLGGALIEASGRIRYEVATQSLYGIAVVLGCLAGVRYGTAGVAYGVLAASLVFYVAKGLSVRAAVGLPVRRYVGAAAPAFLAALAMAAVVHAFLSAAAAHALPIALDGPWERLLTGTLVGVLAYPLALGVLARKQLRLFLDQVAAMAGVARSATLQAKARTIGA